MLPLLLMPSRSPPWRRAQPLEQLALVAGHVLHRDRVEVAVGAGVERHDLLLHGHRAVERLLEQLDEPVAAVEGGLGDLVELGAEGGERLELTELGQVALERAHRRLHGLDLGGAAHAGHRLAGVEGGTHTGLEQVVLEEHLAVGDRDHVGGDVGGDVAGLRLDDRQGGERAGAVGVAELGGALEQAAVQVEDVAGVRLAARGPAEEQRHLAVGLGLLRQVVVDDEAVLAVLHPVLAHGAAGVGGEVLERRRVGRTGDDDDRVVHGAVLLEGGHRVGDGGLLEADGDVDALHAEAALVEDRVDGDGGLAGLAVADDQLALTAADRRHRVDGLDAGLQRLVHRLAADDAGRLDLHPAVLHVGERALAVDGVAEGVDDAAEEAVAGGHREDLAGGLHGGALADGAAVAEHHGADRLLVEVQGQAADAALELEQLVHAHAGQARHGGDAVAHLGDAPDLGGRRGGREALEVLLEGGGDVRGVDGQLCHLDWVPSTSLSGLRTRSGAAGGGTSPSRRSPCRPPGRRSRRARSGR